MMEYQWGNKEEVGRSIEKLRVLMPYWIVHNDQHIRDEEKWLGRIENMGIEEVAHELREAIEISKEANRHIELANKKMAENVVPRQGETQVEEKMRKTPREVRPVEGIPRFEFKQIGVIRTPYTDNAPYQPVEEDQGDFRIVVEPQYADGLYKLAEFRYIYVIYYIHQVKREPSMVVSPPWTGGFDVGVFASRSPVRPNCIGLSVVRTKRIIDNEIFTSGLDVFDGTPALDIKPYIKDLDSKPDANYGWIEEMDDYEHLLLHIKGVPHGY
jgi:tRNA-Thr(GGU) m(6)t(6)A37 methyltransferase TsaA